MTHSTKRVAVGTRTSPLALEQTNEVLRKLREHFPAITFDVVPMSTGGDANKSAPLLSLARGMFVKEIESGLISGDIDIAVHSAKDLPAILPDGLVLGAFTERADPRDTLVSKSGLSLERLPKGAVIGTSSPRREALLKSLRADLNVKPIRGNVGTRLDKSRSADYDAVVLAAAGLIRLGAIDEITEFLDPEVFTPDTGQGALAVEARESDSRILEMLATIDHAPTSVAVRAERSFSRAIGGGCKIPVAAYADISHSVIHVRAMAAMPDGSHVFRYDARFDMSDPEYAGRVVAETLLTSGAGDALAAAGA